MNHETTLPLAELPQCAADMPTDPAELRQLIDTLKGITNALAIALHDNGHTAAWGYATDAFVKFCDAERAVSLEPKVAA